MGLAASQARLLFLTARLSDLELRAQVISNAKMRLANESKSASDEYCRALDKKKFQVQVGYNNQGPIFKDATAENLTTNPSGQQRLIKNGAGKILVSDGIKNAYDSAVTESEQYFNSTAWGETVKSMSAGMDSAGYSQADKDKAYDKTKKNNIFSIFS